VSQQFCQGRLIWAFVLDPRGRNPKKRPVVILTSNQEIATVDVFVTVVASCSAASRVPRPDHFIGLPFQEFGYCSTKLRKPTVVICDWLAEIPKSTAFSSDDFGGIVLPNLLRRIIAKVDEMGSAPAQPPSIG